MSVEGEKLIGLIGTFDVDNFGDCLFPEIYEFAIKKYKPDWSFQLFSPTGKPSAIGSYSKVFELPKQGQDIKKLPRDGCILIGGETLGFGHKLGTYLSAGPDWSPASQLWLGPAVGAGKGQTKFYTHCVGLVPQKNVLTSGMPELLTSCSRLSLRDAYSKKVLSMAGLDVTDDVDPVFITPDLQDDATWANLAASLVPKDYLDKGYIVGQMSFSYLRDSKSLDLFCSQLIKISSMYNVKILLLPICHFLGDELLLKEAQKRLRQKNFNSLLVGGRLNVRETASIISRSSGYCGSSLHGAVVSLSFGKPFCVLGHTLTGKHMQFFKKIGLAKQATVDPSNLHKCFSDCESIDLSKVSFKLRSKAYKGVEKLVEKIEQDGYGSIEGQEEKLKKFEKFESVYGLSSIFKIKRFLFSFTKNTRAIGPWYVFFRARFKGLV